MKIYLYDKYTLEFLKEAEADADPEETKIRGVFVPLLPANATLIEPPQIQENETAVFAGNSWIVYPDYRGKSCKVNADLTVEDITTIGISEDAIIVSKEIGEEIKNHPEMFKIEENEVVRKSEEERNAEIVAERQKRFESAFFQTSLGWIRRKVTMQDGSIKDFLSDLILPIKAGIEMGEDVKIIIYKKPDFTEEDTLEYMESLQERKTADLNFVKECLLQTVRDFGI